MPSSTTAIDRFLSSVERKGFVMARLATGNREDALDLVQDAMTELVARYRDRTEGEWRVLFFKILQSRIRDWYRRSSIRRRWVSFLGALRGKGDGENGADPLESVADTTVEDPERNLVRMNSRDELERALRSLSLRQQQAFLLREWEGLSVAETAQAMGCSQGSVKTHYFRAVATLKTLLEEHDPRGA